MTSLADTFRLLLFPPLISPILYVWRFSSQTRQRHFSTDKILSSSSHDFATDHPRLPTIPTAHDSWQNDALIFCLISATNWNLSFFRLFWTQSLLSNVNFHLFYFNFSKIYFLRKKIITRNCLKNPPKTQTFFAFYLQKIHLSLKLEKSLCCASDTQLNEIKILFFLLW